MKKLTRNEMKHLLGGVKLPEDGCGTGISCAGKASGDSCGSKSCICETNSDKDRTLYCSTQI